MITDSKMKNQFIFWGVISAMNKSICGNDFFKEPLIFLWIDIMIISCIKKANKYHDIHILGYKFPGQKNY